jgi:phosphoglycerate dehydrogenase-like enzyme
VVPFPDAAFLAGVAGNVEVRSWDGVPPAPSWLGDATFYVPQYMAGRSTMTVMAAMPRLEVVQTLTAGVDDVWEHLPSGVTLCNARGVHDASTAELVVGLMVASLRGFPDFVRAQDGGQWRSRRYDALADKRVLLVGYGSVGEAVERRLAGFEVELTRVARSRRSGADPVVHGFDELGELLPGADVLVLTVPLTAETHGMVDAGFLAGLPSGALVVNAARGPVVVTDALLAECATGRLAAALDVTDPEPLPADHALWRLPNVLISPHVGGNTSAFLPRARRMLVDQLGRYARQEPLRHVMDRAEPN